MATKYYLIMGGKTTYASSKEEIISQMEQNILKRGISKKKWLEDMMYLGYNSSNPEYDFYSSIISSGAITGVLRDDGNHVNCDIFFSQHINKPID